MPLKKGDILDEKKRYPESCGLMVKVMSGGAGFEKLICCDHDLTDEDIVPQVGSTLGRKRGTMPVGMILDENKLYPDSCGLRVMILEGGAGFREIICCGHSLTLTSLRALEELSQFRGTPPAPGVGPHGNA
jgi:hypothetical protein